MKKLLLSLALIASVSVLYAAAVKPVLVNSSGATVVASSARILDTIVIGNVAPDNTQIKIYDSATVAGAAASNLKYVIPVSNSLTVTAQRFLVINAYFANGIVVQADALTSTITATFGIKANN